MLFALEPQVTQRQRPLLLAPYDCASMSILAQRCFRPILAALGHAPRRVIHTGARAFRCGRAQKLLCMDERARAAPEVLFFRFGGGQLVHSACVLALFGMPGTQLAPRKGSERQRRGERRSLRSQGACRGRLAHTLAPLVAMTRGILSSVQTGRCCSASSFTRLR